MSNPFDRLLPPSADDLASAAEDEAELLVVDYVEQVLQQMGIARFTAFKSLPKGMQFVYSTVTMEVEVDTGGFNQYFHTSASDFSIEALAGYRRFGAGEHARLLREAIEVYHRERWFHYRIQLRRSLDSFMESYESTQLAEVDARFYELDEDPTERRATYIRTHLEEFLS